MGAMPTLVVGMCESTVKHNMPTTSVGMAPIGKQWHTCHPPCQRSFNWQSTAFVMRGLWVRLPPLALWRKPEFARQTGKFVSGLSFPRSAWERTAGTLFADEAEPTVA